MSPPTPDQETEGAEFRVRFESALESLPARRGEVFRLVRFGHLTYGQVASVLGVSNQTVANHMSLALRDLRHLLSAFLTEPGSADEPGADAPGAGTRSYDG